MAQSDYSVSQLANAVSPVYPDLWLLVLRRYVALLVPANLLWEFGQLPLYTIWREGTLGEMAFAALHCTGGDAVIAVTSLAVALLFCGSGWPIAPRSFRSVVVVTIAIGLGYTLVSEWLNTTVRETWAYSDLMPVIPLLEAGLSPVLQWLLIPALAFWWARKPLTGRTRLSANNLRVGSRQLSGGMR